MIKSPDQELLLAKLLKGKAKFHGYQPVLRYLMENKHYLSQTGYDLANSKMFWADERCNKSPWRCVGFPVH